ncbi:hypothetical protein MYCTH_2307371 [Thermothelomyces thermophilus ATCC 42464]|uniref:Uncharacterized protein n=1 Tax=Thermothelomyces thermophilus (strain ATCC 42464 / BCRC 31852 / DSM 1799) TaxID=573729 RepID=G2QFM7_THET4|nr:uncharacterized protein MYCTH_2307371 [Thermothelomyces thermophilus ATCC 42464]AEO59244.1 hypothetical protein MYCTH_2307371 [Thermothelomyces thermophilus ATCC 42464]
MASPWPAETSHPVRARSLGKRQAASGRCSPADLQVCFEGSAFTWQATRWCLKVALGIDKTH